ncbi:MAG TPA: hypothetical protein VKG21_19350 [Casimicrobiaceae bacterium]|nr:hypothetical protein [Casimicrobiaceae bacterium]
MRADADRLPDPCDAGFYVRYVDMCRQAGIEADSPARFRELVAKWNAMLERERPEQQD